MLNTINVTKMPIKTNLTVAYHQDKLTSFSSLNTDSCLSVDCVEFPWFHSSSSSPYHLSLYTKCSF